ncbi:DUF5058 family protein [Extibacter muris]|uniref:DUF5058 family protein n=1 Tax=Extibacter muris TaxID=1796622 RepID=UPI001D08336A|nr:DUF5058 family protein [Extibacter muris]MCB6201806.1 DUF5058 family protein [Extibacter muris]MCQ4663597.1 DUF5058 family protein [Extibacter muris]MCQ4695030.1 DUF5058 family protein [Extibacter muris]
MKDYMSIAESPVMFLVCAIVILYVLCQSFLFMFRAWRHGKEIGMSRRVMLNTVTGSALFSVVPSIPILIILVMLMSVLGSYFPWLRLSVIGSSSYENVAANIAARSYGLLSYTDEGYNASIFISSMWAMSICILYEPLLVIFGQKSLDRGMTKLRQKKPVIYSLLIDGVFIAMMGWFCAPYLTYWTEKPEQVLSLAALVTAAVAALVFNWLAGKTGKHFFMEMSFPGGMLCGMLGAYIVNLLI